jgi:hypothetical protein
MFPTVRSGGEYLTVKPHQKRGSGAIHQDGTVELKAANVSVTSTQMK